MRPPYTVRAQEPETGATSASVCRCGQDAFQAAQAFRDRGYEKVWIEDASGIPVGDSRPDF